MDPLIEDLLRQAVADTKAGDNEAAREKLEEILEQDEDNIPAWLLLARITDNPDEKRMALSTVLQLDPNNARARQMLDRIEGKTSSSQQTRDEIIPGVPRRLAMMIAGGVGALIVLLIIFAVVIIGGNNAERSAEERSLTQVVLTATGLKLAETQIAAAETQGAFDLTQTQIARVSPTPTPRNTSNAPTLPPTVTPTVPPTETPTLAPVAGIPGTLIGWSGRDLQNRDILPIMSYDLNNPQTPTQLALAEGRYPMLLPNGSQVVYTNYSATRRAFEVQLLTLAGEPVASPLDQAPTLGSFDGSDMPSLSPDGSRLVLIGESFSTRTNEVYLVVLSGSQVGGQSVVQLTNDDANYSYPTIFGDQVVAVRESVQGGTTVTDLVLIDVNSRTFTPLTNDQGATLETMPRWSPDGARVAYAAAPANNRDEHDIYIVTVANPGSGFPLIEAPGDDIYPVFNPDGRFLAFSSNRTGEYNIFLYNLAAQQLFQLTANTEETYPGGWVN